jgi:predicted CXXCH cytochrome family protein
MTMLRLALLTKPPHVCAVLLLLTLGVDQPGLGQEVMPNSSKECAICHIRWVHAFERTDPQAGPMEMVLDRQAGSGDMCLSCHDGSVTDSRFKVWSTRHHTTDSVPSAAVHIPTETFPLDAQGRMTCATCHTAHAVPDSSDLKTVIFLRQPNVDSSLCLACHPEHAAKNDFQHPLGDVNYPIPQEILEAGGKTSAEGHTVICQTCHEPHGARNAWMLVLPPSKLCIACHTDKSPQTAPPAGAPMHHIGQAYPGFKPPAGLLDEKATFGSNGELSCLSCHRLHDASGAKPLLIRKNQDSSLCLDCHEKEKAVLESPHDLRLSSADTVNAGGQTASASGPCGACHRIHGWARDVPETHRPHSSGCMECHQPGGPGSRNRPYVDAHPVGTPVPEDMPTPLPLDEATRSIGCLTCHDPHSPRRSQAGAEAALAPPAGSSAAASRSFLRHEGSGLCVLCHDKHTDLPDQPARRKADQPHDPATFGPAARDRLALHPSVGPCRVCHTTHNARGPHLWARTPATATGRIADLCGACHQDKLGVQNSVHDPASAQWAQKLGFVSKGSCIDCHPVHDPNEEGGIWGAVRDDVGAPQSCETCHRAGAPGKAMETEHIGKTLGTTIENLPENMIVDPDRKIICTTCHDIHQEPQSPKLLVAPVPHLCDICHKDKLGIQGSVHDPATAEWVSKLGSPAGGQGFVSRGPCIDCHPVHGPRGKGGIWAAIGGEDTSAQSCETCHRSGAPGQAVETPHLRKILDTMPENLPDNMTVDRERRIVCTTCHDIHMTIGDWQLAIGDFQTSLPTGKIANRKSKIENRSGPLPDSASCGPSGVCLVCHPQAQGLIGTLHDLRRSAPDARNVRGETAVESGPCGSCHLVHRDPGTGGVWAQGSTLQGKYGSGLCTCCHRQGECASTRVPKYLDHPEVALVNRTKPDQPTIRVEGQPGYAPTFDSRGQPSPTGAISCLTCHQPHPPHPFDYAQDRLAGARQQRGPSFDSAQWAWPSLSGDGEPVEPFLRPQASQGLCVDCHGIETLWRFLYYHKEQRKP